MHAFLRLADALSRAGAVFAALSLVSLVILSGAEIVLRSFFSTSLSFVVEYNGYLLVVAFLGGCGQAMREGGHIRVTMILQAIPEKAARAVDIACTISGLFLSGYLCVAMAKLAYGSFQYGTLSFFASRTPLAYPQSMATLMLAIFVIAVAARLLRLLIGEAPEQVPEITGVAH